MRGDSSDLENGTLLYPIRVGWQTVVEQNNRHFYMHITEGNESSEILPGYRCHSGSKFSDIETAPSYAITSLYQRFFPDSKTKFSGPLVLGWDDNELLEVSLKDLHFRAFAIKIDSKILVYITNISVGRQKNTLESYTASFIGDYNKKRALFVQIIRSENYEISIYPKDNEPMFFFGSSPTEVWKNVGFYKKYRGTQLFGLEHPMTQKAINTQQIPTCSPTFWNNETLMDNIFNYHLRKRTLSNINWQQFFQNWLAQESTIIELREELKKIYPPNYLHDERELRAWRAMLRAAGCTEITPFSKDQSEVVYLLINDFR
jgi:hypothetical protein